MTEAAGYTREGYKYNYINPTTNQKQLVLSYENDLANAINEMRKHNKTKLVILIDQWRPTEVLNNIGDSIAIAQSGFKNAGAETAAFVSNTWERMFGS